MLPDLSRHQPQCSKREGWIFHAQFSDVALFNKEHIRLGFRYRRGWLRSIIEHRNVPEHRTCRIYVHYLLAPILILLEGANLATDNNKEPSRGFPAKK